MKLPKAYVGCSVPHSTLLPDDLVESFAQFVQEALPGTKCAERAGALYAEYLQNREQEDEYVYCVLDDLFDLLNEVAPEGTCFGVHPGNGSDFGFWPVCVC